MADDLLPQTTGDTYFYFAKNLHRSPEEHIRAGLGFLRDTTYFYTRGKVTGNPNLLERARESAKVACELILQLPIRETPTGFQVLLEDVIKEDPISKMEFLKKDPTITFYHIISKK